MVLLNIGLAGFDMILHQDQIYFHYYLCKKQWLHTHTLLFRFLFSDENFFTKFLSLGVAASVGIIVGGLIVCIFCTISLICCCRNSFCKKRAPSGSSNNMAPSAAGMSLTNGAPGSHHGGSHHGSVHGSHHGSHHGNGHQHHGNGQTQMGRGEIGFYI